MCVSVLLFDFIATVGDTSAAEADGNYFSGKDSNDRVIFQVVRFRLFVVHQGYGGKVA
jgi:hypothetical protein